MGKKAITSLDLQFISEQFTKRDNHFLLESYQRFTISFSLSPPPLQSTTREIVKRERFVLREERGVTVLTFDTCHLSGHRAEK